VRIVVDSYAWIEVFLGSEKGDKARKIIGEASEVYTPDVVLAEVARKYLREGSGEDVILNRLRAMTEATDVVPVGVELALESAKCYLKLSEKAKMERTGVPSLFDALVLATARVLDARVVTGDEHFKNLSETLWVG
jgi:predicted nucleic acid-binding protein